MAGMTTKVQANRLRAAAHDLYVALKAMEKHFGPLDDNILLNDECRAAFSLARAALAKADRRKP